MVASNSVRIACGTKSTLFHEMNQLITGSDLENLTFLIVKGQHMLNMESGIDSLTNFKRQTSEYLERLHETGDPVVLTVNGKSQVVIQDVAAYQRLVELAAKADRQEAVEAIREGLADMEAGRTKPVRAALRALAKKYGISLPDK